MSGYFIAGTPSHIPPIPVIPPTPQVANPSHSDSFRPPAPRRITLFPHLLSAPNVRLIFPPMRGCILAPFAFLHWCLDYSVHGLKNSNDVRKVDRDSAHWWISFYLAWRRERLLRKLDLAWSLKTVFSGITAEKGYDPMLNRIQSDGTENAHLSTPFGG